MRVLYTNRPFVLTWCYLKVPQLPEVTASNSSCLNIIWWPIKRRDCTRTMQTMAENSLWLIFIWIPSCWWSNTIHQISPDSVTIKSLKSKFYLDRNFISTKDSVNTLQCMINRNQFSNQKELLHQASEWRLLYRVYPL